MKLVNTLKGLSLSLVLGMSVASAGIIEQWDVDFLALEGSSAIKAAGSQNKGSFSVDADSIELSNNAWFYIDLNNIIGQSSLSLDEPNSDIILSFDFLYSDGNQGATSLTEVAGIQFSNGFGPSLTNAFNLFGEQTWGLTDFSYTGSGLLQHFEINLDKYVQTNSFSKIVFIHDCDGNEGITCNVDSKVIFSNVSISKVPEPSTIAILGLGLLGLVASRKRKA